MKKFVGKCLIVFSFLIIFSVAFCASFVSISYLKYQKLPLDAEKLATASVAVAMFDGENRPIKDENQFNNDVCKIENLNNYTKDAFISIEDKEFYKHKGLNKKRIAKAMWNNLKSHSLKEGASTISQQLIKNTHLSNEKTFERKLKEMALTKKLEKTFSKDEILESYLNIIFFGNNCYGLESAANYYFNKDAKDLSLNESCTLAGLIKSPTKYSPILNYENSIKRRNLVLSEMEKDGKISVDEKIKNQNEPICLDVTPKSSSRLNSYSQASLDEASKILNLPAKQIAYENFKIHTYLNLDKQTALKNALDSKKLEKVDNAGIVIDAEKHAVTAYHANSNFKLLNVCRQPASCLKPLLVYTPALNEGSISPSTQVLDEKIQIGSYSPTNVNKKFSGYVSVTEAVKNSINIPAIKVLSYIGIDTGKQYAEKLGIKFDEKDNSYALALGGMTQGVSLKDLTTAYTVFANNGQFSAAHFVQYITDKNNKLVYMHKPEEKMVFREDSAYLMTSILQETAKTGTARKLSDITNTEIAAKTGTVGNKDGNTDAYTIAYTPTEAIGVWFGSASNTPAQIVGGNQPAQVVRSYVQSQSYEKNQFEVPSSVVEEKIDSLELEENHCVMLASPYAPERYTQSALFSRFNLPSEVSENFTTPPQIIAEASAENNQVLLTLHAQRHLNYQIYKNDIPYQKIEQTQEKILIRLPFNEKSCTIKIVASYDNSTLTSEKTFALSNKNQESNSNSKWYI